MIASSTALMQACKRGAPSADQPMYALQSLIFGMVNGEVLLVGFRIVTPKWTPFLGSASPARKS